MAKRDVKAAKPKPRIPVKATVRVNAYGMISDDMEEAIQHGLNRAYKHSNKPTRETLVFELHNAIMTAICERLHFDDGRD